MIRRLQKKFILAALLAVFLVLLVLIGAINFLNYRNLVKEADSTLQILAGNKGTFPMQMRFLPEEHPEEGIGRELETPPEEMPGEPFRHERGGYGELAFQSRYFSARFSAEGTLSSMDMENIFSMREDEARVLAEAVYASGKEKGFSSDYRYCRTECDGETMLVFLNCERELSTFRTFLLGSAAVSLAGIAAVLVLIVVFSGKVVGPIAESYEKQKQFITDAGHELKTPITIINADVEVLESEAQESEMEWLSDIRKQTRRLTSLTADLIYLAKMEEEGTKLQMSEFSLSELTEETARSFQAPALSQGKHFSISVQPEVMVIGDEKALAKLISILLDNAMKYSPEGGDVSIDLRRSGKMAQLTVRNSAENMEKGNADRLFERFYRTDSSRNSDTGGFGLGLAVAKAVTEAHRGRIHAESEDGQSLTVEAGFTIHNS